MRFTDWMCPICKRVDRRWDWTPNWCSLPACKQAHNVTIKLPDGSEALSPVRMVIVSGGTMTNKLSITLDS